MIKATAIKIVAFCLAVFWFAAIHLTVNGIVILNKIKSLFKRVDKNQK